MARCPDALLFEHLLPQLEQRVTAARLLYRCGSVDIVLRESVLWLSFFALRKPWDPRVSRSGQVAQSLQ
jgi:hypothetical protein